MSQNHYNRSASCPWYVKLLDYFPTLRSLQSEADAERWESEIDRQLGTRPATGDELYKAVLLACDTKRMAELTAYDPPTPTNVAAWVRAVRRRDDRMDTGRDDRRYTNDPVAVKAAYDVIHDWNQRNREGPPKAEVGDGYHELDAGTALTETDEFWNGQEWIPYGANAKDSDGHARRLVRYRATLARRRNAIQQPQEAPRCP